MMLRFNAIWPPASLALLALAIGLYPHVRFSIEAGQFAYFKSAFDEDTYALYPQLATFRVDRVLGATTFELLRLLLGGSHQAALVAMDAIFPPLVVLACWWCARELFSSPPGRLLFALALAFAPDLFTLGNSTIFGEPPLDLNSFRALFGSWGQVLVPPYETSYLALARTPEPQTGFAVGYALIALMLALARRGQITFGHLVTLAAVQACLTCSYAFVSYPVLLSEAGVAAVLALRRQWASASVLAVLFALSAMAILLSMLASAGTIDGMIFASRLPSVTPSELAAFALAVAIFSVMAQRQRLDGGLLIALVFVAIPLVLPNQQLVTGLMISARDWERNINPGFVVMGAGLFVSALDTTRVASLFRVRWMAGAATALLVLVLGGAVARNYERVRTSNFATLAMERALDAAAPIAASVRIVLDAPGYAPLLALRRGGRRESILDFTDVFLHPIPPQRTAQFVSTPPARSLFAYWRLIGVSPTEAERVLRGEVASRGGYFSAFVFPLCDFWYPCTDSRALRTELVEDRIPGVVAAYAASLNAPLQEFSGTLLYVTAVDDASVAAAGFDPWDPLAQAEAGGLTARVYILGDADMSSLPQEP